jgi:hypothetical protein
MTVMDVTVDSNIWPTGGDIQQILDKVRDSTVPYEMSLNINDLKTVLNALVHYGSSARGEDREVNLQMNNALDILSEVFKSVGIPIPESDGNGTN